MISSSVGALGNKKCPTPIIFLTRLIARQQKAKYQVVEPYYMQGSNPLELLI